MSFNLSATYGSLLNEQLALINYTLSDESWTYNISDCLKQNFDWLYLEWEQN